MRWNLLFLIFDFLIIPLPLWIDIFSPIFAAAAQQQRCRLGRAAAVVRSFFPCFVSSSG